MLRAIILLPVLSALLFAAESGWNTVWGPHFIYHRESAAAGQERAVNFEKIFRVLRKDMWQLSSWMDTGKTEVYVYRDQKSYAAGRFKPPEWSAAAVSYSGRPGSAWSLAIFEPLNARTVAHELTHLYFQSFFRNSAGRIPVWLNEGLAEMMAEAATGNGAAMPRLPAAEIPMADFLKMKQVPDARPADFYPQAHSLVRFLKTANSPFKFEKFCRQLRDGEQVERALASAYGFRTAVELEKAWKKWAGSPGAGTLGTPRN